MGKIRYRQNRIFSGNFLALLASFLILPAIVLLVQRQQNLSGKAQTSFCYFWPNSNSSITLQAAVTAYPCVKVGVGTFNLTSPITITSNRTLIGSGRDKTILKAVNGNIPWPNNRMEGVLQTVNLSDTGVQISELTVNANNLATYAACCRGMTINNIRATNAICNGIGIVGYGMVIRNSLIDKNGFSCPVAPPGAGIYASAYPQDGVPSSWSPVIENNEIVDNGGPGVDINKVWRGTLIKNYIARNKGWAAVSLYGASYWTINTNTINAAYSNEVQPYHSKCVGGPRGNHNAGLFLCEDTDINNDVTISNQIIGNKIAGWYGILSIGDDERVKYLVPHDNTFTNNIVTGSAFGCADDFKPGQWATPANTWSGNNCTGIDNTAPTYF